MSFLHGEAKLKMNIHQKASYLNQIKYKHIKSRVKQRSKKMRIPLYDIVTVYENIIKDINIAQASMIIFTALDVDALCTLKILSKFFQNENIQYTFHPVSSYTDLQQKIQDCKGNEKIKLFFFINCGGLIDLTTKWFAKSGQIFLFDVNKPIHHANVAAPNIKIIDDQLSQLDKAPTNKQVEMYQNFDQVLEEFQEKANEEGGRQEQSDQIDQLVAPKRKRHPTVTKALKELQKMRKLKASLTQKVQEYYYNQFYSLPSSFISYRLIKDLKKSNNAYLWYAIVGITSMFLEQKIQKQQFESICSLYRIDLAILNREEEKPGKDTLKKKLDFQFPLLRHWSLYESVMNSWYMIAGLRLWTEDGVKKFYQLISFIGLSLDQSKQLYKYMLKQSIQKLEGEIINQASQEKFKLADIAFPSFAKQVDYAFQMTASDYYYVLATVLERPAKRAKINQSFDEEVREHRISCFLTAYQLFNSNQTKLQSTIEQAKQTLKIYTKQALNILQRNNMMNSANLTVVGIYNDTQDRKILDHPNSLTKLAYMLMYMNKQKYRFKVYKPLILTLTNNTTQRTKVVGIMNQAKNTYASKFNVAIQKLNIQAGLDSFMNNVMILPKNSIISFVREVGAL